MPRSCSSRRAPHASCAARLWLDGLVSALGVAALTAALLLQPIVSSTGGEPLQVATTLAYPLADVTLLAFVVGLLALSAWKPSRSWALIAAGLATMAVADGIFLWQSANGIYAEGKALDALWPAAALLLGHAAWQPSAREATRLEGWRLLAMPALFALMPVGLLVYGNLRADEHAGARAGRGGARGRGRAHGLHVLEHAAGHGGGHRGRAHRLPDRAPQQARAAGGA